MRYCEILFYTKIIFLTNGDYYVIFCSSHVYKRNLQSYVILNYIASKLLSILVHNIRSSEKTENTFDQWFRSHKEDIFSKTLEKANKTLKCFYTLYNIFGTFFDWKQ